MYWDRDPHPLFLYKLYWLEMMSYKDIREESQIPNTSARRVLSRYHIPKRESTDGQILRILRRRQKIPGCKKKFEEKIWKATKEFLHGKYHIPTKEVEEILKNYPPICQNLEGKNTDLINLNKILLKS